MAKCGVRSHCLPCVIYFYLLQLTDLVKEGEAHLPVHLCDDVGVEMKEQGRAASHGNGYFPLL